MTDCQHLIGGQCEIASRLAERPVVPWENVCETCMACTSPYSENYVTASIAIHVWTRAGDHVTAEKVRHRMRRRGLLARGRIAAKQSSGAGSVLHWMLRYLFRMRESMDCECMAVAREMDRNGIRWTLRHATDIVSKMAYEYRRRRPDSRRTERTLRCAAYTIIYAACAWRFFVSSRIPSRGP